MRELVPTANIEADRLAAKPIERAPVDLMATRFALRDDSGKVRRTLLRDERAGWLKENRAFRIIPRVAAAKAS